MGQDAGFRVSGFGSGLRVVRGCKNKVLSVNLAGIYYAGALNFSKSGQCVVQPAVQSPANIVESAPDAIGCNGTGFRVQGFGFQVQGFGFRVQILALAFSQTSLQRLRLFPPRSEAGMQQPRFRACGSLLLFVLCVTLFISVSIARALFLSLVFNQGQAGRHLADEEGATLQLQRVCA